MPQRCDRTTALPGSLPASRSTPVFLLLLLATAGLACRGNEARPPAPAIPAPATGAPSPAPRPAEDTRPPGYVGSEVCRPCHTEIHQAWQDSWHYRHMAAPSPEHVLGDFERNNEHVHAGTRSRMFRRDGEYFLEYTGPDGQPGTWRIDYALGYQRQQIYLHTLPSGRIQILPTHWDIPRGRWEDSTVAPLTDGPDPRPVTHFTFWKNYGRTFNLVCMECHASQPRKNFEVAANRYRSVFDPRINCEACHGPAARHVAARNDPRPEVQQQDHSLVRLDRIPQTEAIELCSSCHARKRIYREGFVPGQSSWDYFVPDVWDEENFHVDGRSSSTTYNWVEFMQSACQRRSTERLDCAVSCHPPHGTAGRPQSLAEANAPCTRCHVRHGGEGLTAHTFHGGESEGSRCTACHMPRLDVSGMPLVDHTISVPLPELNRRFGVPDACTLCHRDDSAEWAEQHVRSWYGGSPTFQLYRTRLLERAETLSTIFARKEPLPVEVLVRWLDDTGENVVQRASAAKFLGRAGPEDARALQALLRHRRDHNPLVRYYVIEGLSSFPAGREALREALQDPMRSHRVRAYEGLLLQQPSLARETAAEVVGVRQEWEERNAVVRPDNPQILSEMALWHFQQGDTAKAEELLRRGVALTEPVPQPRVDLIQFLLGQNRLPEAEREVRALEAVDPEGAEAGTARVQLHLLQGHPQEALALARRLEQKGLGSELLSHIASEAQLQLQLAPLLQPMLQEPVPGGR